MIIRQNLHPLKGQKGRPSREELAETSRIQKSFRLQMFSFVWRALFVSIILDGDEVDYYVCSLRSFLKFIIYNFKNSFQFF